MSLRDRENNRRTSVVSAIINSDSTPVEIVEAENTTSEVPKQDEGALKARSYYLTERLYKAVNLKAAFTGVDKSTVVRDSLALYLQDILDEYK